MLQTKAQKALSMLEYEVFLDARDTDGPEVWRRKGHRERIEQHRDKVERLGMYGLVWVARVANKPLYGLLFSPYERRGYTVLNSGANATVLEKDNQVTKVMRYTSPASADRFRELIAANTFVHPEETVETQVIDNFETAHFGIRCIALQQPLLTDVVPLETFPELGTDMATRVATFAQRSLDELAPFGIAPDVTGSGNLLGNQAVDSLKLIDTVAFTIDDNPENFDKNLARLRRLAHAQPHQNIADIYHERP